MNDTTTLEKLTTTEKVQEKIDHSKQVSLFKLIFSQSWEDPQSDIKAFGDLKGKTVLSITSGNDNSFEFLLNDPKKIYAADINPVQNHLLDLKIKSAKHLNYSQFSSLMGLNNDSDKMGIYNSIRNSLSTDAKNYWDNNKSIINKGIIYAGKFEGFLLYVRLLFRILQGNKKITDLFELTTLEEQEKFYKENWDNKRLRWLFKLAFHKSIYPRGALNADYFTFDDGSVSFADSFYKRFRHALTEIPVDNNYFLAMYLMGHYANPSSMPGYLKEENFSLLQDRSDRISSFTGSAVAFLQQMPENSIDCFSLSNICELMSKDETERLFNEVARTATPGARICFRNLIVPREPNNRLIQKDETLSKELLYTDRSFIYSKVAAYEVIK